MNAEHMNDLTEGTLALQKAITELSVAQAKLVQEGIEVAMGTAAGNLELARDAQLRLSQRWLEALTPKAPASSAS